MVVVEELIRLLREEIKGFTAFQETQLLAMGDRIKNRIIHLARIAREPGFSEAVKAERDSIVLELGILSTNAGDEADARVKMIINTTLGIASKMLAGMFL